MSKTPFEITKEEIVRNYKLAKGIFLCIENAESLLLDAKVLFQNQRYQMCIPIGIFALEEVGKALMIQAKFFWNTEQLNNKINKNFMKHDKKLKALLEAYNQYRPDILKSKEEIARLHKKWKEDCLYVNLGKNDKYFIHKVNKEQAETMISTAEMIITKYYPLKMFKNVVNKINRMAVEMSKT